MLKYRIFYTNINFGEDIMSNNPKFMVFHLRELIYTLIFIVLGIVLILMLVFMFKDKESKSQSTGTYASGIYSTKINLNDASMEVKMAVDKDHINAITISSMDDSVATMYPLVKPAFDDITNQIVNKQSTDKIEYKEGSMYTYTLLVNSIEQMINDAKIK